MINGPYIKSKNTSFKMMINLFISLVPIIIFAIYKNGYLLYQSGKATFINMLYPLLIIILPAIVTFIIELLYSAIFLKQRKNDILKYFIKSYSFIPGLLLGLIMPINIPISFVLIGAVILSLSKILFKKIGNVYLNWVLVAYLLIFLIFNSFFQVSSNYLNALELDKFNLLPLENVNIATGIGDYGTLVKPYGSLFDFFIGLVPGEIGVTSILLCLISFIYLTITKSIKWKIPVVYILTVFFITFMIGNINGVDIWYPLFQILSGGLVFSSIFLAADSFNSPVTTQGQILYGLFLGICTVLVRYFLPIEINASFISILFMNIFINLLDKIGSKSKFDFRISIIPYLIAWGLIIGLGYYIGNSYIEKNRVLDSNFKIEERNTIGTKTTYIVVQNGYDSSIRAKIIINNEKVISYEVLEQNDKNFSKIIDSKYLDKLISNQFSLENVDPVNGAISTSNCLKKILQNVLKDYKNYDKPDIIEEKKDYEISSVVENDDSIDYLIIKQCNGSYVELKITFIHDIIDQITVVNQNNIYFNLIVENDYITKIIENQQVLDDLYLVEGAEDISLALKTAVKLTLEDYKQKYAINDLDILQ